MQVLQLFYQKIYYSFFLVLEFYFNKTEYSVQIN